MPYAGLPEGAIVYEGLPKGATIISQPQYNMYTGGKTPEEARKEFLRTEGTLATRIHNTPVEEAAKNMLMEVPRFAQEVITTPINAAINIGRTAYGKYHGEQYPDIRRAAQELNVRGPLEPSMTGELIGQGIETGTRTLRDLGVEQPTIDALTDIASLYGGKAVAKPIAGRLSDLGKVVAERSIGQLPEKLYASSLKQSTTIPMEQRAANIQTGLRGGYVPSKKGLEALYTDINQVNNQIGQAISESSLGGGKVSVDSIVKTLEYVKQRAIDSFGDNNNIISKIDDFEASLRDHPSVVNGELPIDVAQRMKVNTYKQLKNAYGELKGFEVEAKKAMARGAKEEIVNAIPELAELNAKDSALINLEKVLFKAVNRIENRDLVGIGVPIKIATGAMGGPKGAIIGALTGLVDTPSIKAHLAIALHKARTKAGQRSTITSAKIDAGNILQNLKSKLRDERGLIGNDISNVKQPIYYRRTKSPNLYNDVDWAMFADDAEKVLHYGDYEHQLNIADIPKDKTISASDPRFKRMVEKELIKNRELLKELQATPKQISKELNPVDIVDTAGVWDNSDLTMLIWDKILEPNGIIGVKTDNGFLLFDKNYTKPAIKKGKYNL